MKLVEKINNCKTADEKNEILRNTNLCGVNLINANLSNANFINANLSNANFINANLSNANFINANLSNANFINANLCYADLRYADLSNADLRYADLSNADLRYADLSNADLRYANLSNADLRVCGRWSISFNGEKIKIGCKTMDDWEAWFYGTEEFETPRGTFEFFEIEHNYRWFVEFMKKYPAEFGVKQ